MSDKKEFLELLYEEKGDYKIHYVNKEVGVRTWKKDMYYTQAKNIDIEQCNLRRILAEELILDIEGPNQLPLIKQKLLHDGWAYELWSTGSRGFHIRIMIPELKKIERDVRNKFRKGVIQDYQCDVSKANEDTWIAVEYADHFKSGNQKTLLETKEGRNTLNTKDNANIKHIQETIKEKRILQDAVINKKKNTGQEFLKDPYLKYALENKILQGERNTILFKNLAVGLVNAGMSREEIEAHAEVIANNCPGKTKQEFMGWARKALSDEIIEYNKIEMLEWAERNKHPIYYERIQGIEDLLQTLTPEQKWSILWDSQIKDQEVWKHMCFINLLTSVIYDEDRDLRVPVCITSGTSTGKDTGINLEKRFMDALGMKTAKLIQVTDRSLIGAVNPFNHDHNQKHELLEGEVIEKGKKTLEWKNPVDYGMLQDHEWIAFPECESILKPVQYSKNIQAIVRMALDKTRMIERAVKGVHIKFYTRTNIVLATYPLPGVVQNLMDTGLFQRFLYHNKPVKEELYDGIVDFMTDKLFTNESEQSLYDEKEYFNSLLGDLKNIKEWHEKNKQDMSYDKSAPEYVRSLMKKHQEDFKYLAPEDRYILKSQNVRGLEHIQKISIAYAASMKKKKIGKEYIDKAFWLYSSCHDSLKNVIVHSNKNTKYDLFIKEMLSQKQKIPQAEFVTQMQRVFEISDTKKVREIIKFSVAQNKIKVVKEGRFNYIIPAVDFEE